MSLLSWGAQNWTLWLWLQQDWVRRQDHLPQPATNALPDVTQDPTGLLDPQGTAGSWTALCAPGPSRSFSPELLPSRSVPVSPGAWGFSFPGPGSAIAFVELQRVLLCQSLQPVEVLLKGCTTPTSYNHSSCFFMVSMCTCEVDTFLGASIISSQTCCCK